MCLFLTQPDLCKDRQNCLATAATKEVHCQSLPITLVNSFMSDLQLCLVYLNQQLNNLLHFVDSSMLCLVIIDIFGLMIVSIGSCDDASLGWLAVGGREKEWEEVLSPKNTTQWLLHLCCLPPT